MCILIYVSYVCIYILKKFKQKANDLLNENYKTTEQI